MEIKLDSRFKKTIRGTFERYEFEVGVLNDAPHKEAKRGERGKGGSDVKSSYAGGPIRKKSSVDSGLSISEVGASFRETTGINYLTEPFKNKSSDILKFTNGFFNYVFGKSTERRLTNLLQAIVRNPMLKGGYGSNSSITQKIKGFDRLGVDTAQLFKAIKARVRTRGGK